MSKEVVKQLGANWPAHEGEVFREEPAVVDKSQFVDMISEATRQTRRRITPRAVEPEVKEKSRLGHRSARWVQWRLETLTPWRLKPWKFKDWD